MNIELKKYNFSDVDLFETATSNVHEIWIPEMTCIVLGQSNTVESTLIVEHVINDKIPVYKRPSGGQTVVISPNTIIISIITLTKKFQNPQYYFKLINKQIIQVLENLGLKNLMDKGISDIAIGERKILGSSIYRRKEKMLYHAVLNVSEPVSTFKKYLTHPEKEPEYRKGRSHEAFVTSLKEQGCEYEINAIAEKLREGLDDGMMG